jgi:RNA polymerase sigma-70 factor (ECF subfamily)
MLEEERHIILRAVEGGQDAFEKLYDHYQPQIYRFVLVKVSHKEDAEDLTHQIFMNAWTNIRSYRDVGLPFSSWLYAIARNEVIDFYRRQKPRIPLDDYAAELIADQHTLDVDTETRLSIERAMEAIRLLKPEHQDVILMRFVEEMSVREVAQTIGKSEGAIKVIQHRALKQLREILEEFSNDPNDI